MFDHRRFFLLMKTTVSLMLLYPGVYGTFDTSDVDLHTATRDSVYSARCFLVPLILYGIQVFLIFLVGLYIDLMSCFLRILLMRSVAPCIYILLLYIIIMDNQRTIMWKSARKPILLYCELVVTSWSEFQ